MSKQSVEKVQKVRKSRKLGAGLTAPQREELLRIPTYGFVVVKPSSRMLNQSELNMHRWALNRNVMSILESNGLVEPICIPGRFQYGYQLTGMGRLVVESLINPPKPKPRVRKRPPVVEKPVSISDKVGEDDSEKTSDEPEKRAA